MNSPAHSAGRSGLCISPFALGTLAFGRKRGQGADGNLGKQDMVLPDELPQSPGAVSALPQQFPFSLFDPLHQAGMNGGTGVGAKPAG